jgi:ubiquinone/menaquinone biosynthesis C-methylase UbiE
MIAIRKHPLVETFLKPVLQFAIEADPLNWSRGRDWQQLSNQFRQPNVTYASHYADHSFHGIEGGYLNPHAALSYDLVSQFLLFPHEASVRCSLLDAVAHTPRHILDLGCGTGSTTLMLKQKFPHAQVVGLDLSPYMLVMAAEKAQKAGLNLEWQHGMAENTQLPNESFDLITASLLFHEIPPTVAQAVLAESYRLLAPGGQIIVFDGSQGNLKDTAWVGQWFEEPYMASYMAESLDHWMTAAGFQQVQTQTYWWLYQVSQGTKIT